MTALRCTNATTQPTDTPMDESEFSLSVQVKNSSSEPNEPMPSLSGDDSSMTVVSKVSTVLSSETKASTNRPNSFDKRMRLLIASGLIKGITPTSMRNGSRQGILATAFYELDGSDADTPREDL